MVSSDVRRGDLVNKRIKRGIINLIQIKFFHSIRFKSNSNSIKVNLMCFKIHRKLSFVLRRCVYDLKYICSWNQTCCGNSTIQKLVPHSKVGNGPGFSDRVWVQVLKKFSGPYAQFFHSRLIKSQSGNLNFGPKSGYNINVGFGFVFSGSGQVRFFQLGPLPTLPHTTTLIFVFLK